ncbi:MAG: hypothetical protein Tp1111DCM298921_47 [Prokaryotic dsDNA virus sp.]|nr:MAG: hypothetical protein Tp1111DCM298921_47 [Prokaryotic dsDNA virus sp.]|tara:strand:- start:34701 stop:34958 length:258 start_codon:yes stop_codon:yes gene_type:complete
MIQNEFQVDELIHKKGLEYGHPMRFFRQLARVWSGVLDVDITPEQAATMMVLFKSVRLYNKPDKVDTQDDIQGYLKIIDILNNFE